jgi:hypothetical protein
VDDKLLAQVAKALKVSPEAIKNFNDEATINNIRNINENSLTMFNYQFNPIEKYLEMVEKNTQFYECLLQSEQEKVELLEKVLDLKNNPYNRATLIAAFLIPLL